jgi:ribosomal protein S14
MTAQSTAMQQRIDSLLQPDSTRECGACGHACGHDRAYLCRQCFVSNAPRVCNEWERVIADLLKERDEMRLRLQYAECVFCGLYVQGCSCSDWARVLKSCPTCHGNHTPDQLCGHGGSD